MAVEARHMNVFQSKFITNRYHNPLYLCSSAFSMMGFSCFLYEFLFFWLGLWFSCRDFVKLNQGIPNIYNTQMDSMLPQAATMPETLPPYYQSVDCSNLGASPKTFINKADSGLTYTIPVPDQRKRPRDSFNDFNALPIRQKTNKVSGLPSFLDQDIILQIYQQQLEIDRFLAQHVSNSSLCLSHFFIIYKVCVFFFFFFGKNHNLFLIKS